MNHLPFLTIDFIVFFILYLVFSVNWVVAFFASTAITWAGYYLYYMLFPLSFNQRKQ